MNPQHQVQLAEQRLKEHRADKAKKVQFYIDILLKLDAEISRLDTDSFFYGEAQALHDSQQYIKDEVQQLAQLRDQLQTLPVSGHHRIADYRKQLGLDPHDTSQPRQAMAHHPNMGQRRTYPVEQIRAYIQASGWTTQEAVADKFNMRPAEVIQVCNHQLADMQLRIQGGIIHT